MQQLANDNIRKMHKIEILAEKGLRKRVLMYLDILRRKAGSDTVSVRMSREQMAQYPVRQQKRPFQRAQQDEA